MATLIAGFAAVLLAAPLFYQLSGSLMTPDEARSIPPVLVPADPRFGNFPGGWNGIGIGGLLFTSAILAVLAAALQVLTGAAAAFALARLRFPGRRSLVRLVAVLAAVPSLVLVVPRFVMIDAWGWTGGFTGLAVPALVSAGAILFLYQVFRTLPREPEESARLDGAGPWVVFSRVVVPQARPALAVVAGLAALAQWRSLLWPLVVTGRGAGAGGPDVAEQGLARLLSGTSGGLSVPELFATGVTIALPALAVAVWLTLARARATGTRRGFERELPAEISP
ncbi:MAG TPA: ABC transporter permease subunit, partial [Gemmatimonadales bacterium]|nr:ABC transporter permease subunit [Gemmatimonadales bacterium]